jgi:hypothetical protein
MEHPQFHCLLHQKSADDNEERKQSECRGTSLHKCLNKYDAVVSYKRWDRTGPNPDPLHCYIQQKSICKNDISSLNSK